MRIYKMMLSFYCHCYQDRLEWV